MQLLLYLVYTCELRLPTIVERVLGNRFKVPSVLSHATSSTVTTRAHAAVVSESALV